MPLGHGRSPIGIDIGADRIKAAQVVRTRQGWRIMASVSLSRREHAVIPTEDEVCLLADILNNTGFTGSKVIMGAPRSLLSMAVLDLPPKTSGAPVEQICAAEFARMFRFAPGSYEMHAWEMPTATDRATTTQMAASGMECENAALLIAPFEAVGLKIAAIDLASEATSRACRSGCHDTDELTTLLDIGWSGVDLVVFRGGEVVYERWLRGTGLGSLVENLRRSLNLSERAARILVRRVGLAGIEDENADPVIVARMLSIVREYAEDLLQQVFGSVAYVLDRFPGESVAHMRVCGGGGSMPQFAAYLAEMAGLDVQLITPLDCGFVGGRAAEDPHMLTALGHALWGSE